MTLNKEMPFWDHVEELRWRIFKCLLAIIVGAILTFNYSDLVLKLLIQPSKDLQINLNLQVLKITSMFMVKMGLSVMGGILIGMPVILFQIWKFIVPAFAETQNISAFLFVSFSFIFFMIGIFFGYKIVIPFSLGFFTNMTTTIVPVAYNFTLDGYLVYVMWMMFACGLVFQLPVISLIGTKVGILTPAFLRHYRKYAIISFLIFGALLTPPDPLSQLLIFIPMIMLYEFSIFLSWIFNRRNHS